jgi:hypothetical protein
LGKTIAAWKNWRHARFRYKVELEALNWLGMDYCSEWVCSIFSHQDQVEAGNDDGEEWLEII